MMPNPSRPTSHSSTMENFDNFYRTWVERQQGFLEQLLQVEDCNEESQLGLINQVLCHYRLYHDQISMAAGEDVFLVSAAPWLSSYERTLLWISGFRPSTVFRLLEGAVKDLTAEQAARVEEVKADVSRKEKELTEVSASLQERVAAPLIVRLVIGEISEMENVFEELKVEMLVVFNAADMLRGSTMKRVMEILRSDQTVRLLAAATKYQVRIRRWGMLRNLQGTTGSSASTSTSAST